MNPKLKAFSILELAMVLAILSLLIGMVWTSTNRFQDQMQTSTKLSHEITAWYRFRSNFWREIYSSDSIKVVNQSLYLHQGGEVLVYQEMDSLIRLGKGMTIGFPYHLAGLHVVNQANETGYVDCQISWKDQLFSFQFPLKESLKEQIDAHYTIADE